MKTLILTDREFEIINNRCNIPTLAFDNAIPKGMTKDDFRGFAFVLSILIGIYGIANHLLRDYQDVQLTIVGIFWTVGSFITIAIGNFVVFLNMHFVNNVLFDLARYFAADAIKIYFGVFIVALIIGYMWWYGQVKKQKMFGLLGDKSRLTRHTSEESE